MKNINFNIDLNSGDENFLNLLRMIHDIYVSSHFDKKDGIKTKLDKYEKLDNGDIKCDISIDNEKILEDFKKGAIDLINDFDNESK